VELLFEFVDVFVALCEGFFLFFDSFEQLFVCSFLAAELSAYFVERAIHACVFGVEL